MAIEVEQKGTADVLSDVFSVGVTLLELWVGSIGPTFDEYEGVEEVGPEGTFRLVCMHCSPGHAHCSQYLHTWFVRLCLAAGARGSSYATGDE